MTNAEFQGMIEEFGDRIIWLQLNNNYKIYVGYEGAALRSVKDIVFKKFGNAEWFGIRQIPAGQIKFIKDEKTGRRIPDPDQPKVYTTWHDTALIETVCVMEEDFKDYILNPLLLS